MFTLHAIRSPRRCARSASLMIPLVALLATSCSHPLATAIDPSQVPGAAGSGGRGALPPSQAFDQSIDDIERQIVVTLGPNADLEAIAESFGATVVDVQQGFAVLERPPGEPLDVSIQEITQGRILSAEDNSLALPAEARQKSWAFDDGFGSLNACTMQLAAERLGIATANTVSRGSGVIVAVLDTGIDPTHPLFAGRLVPGWDFVSNDSDPTDTRDGVDEDGDGVVDGAFGHGTHVAGIIALAAPRALIMPVRVLDNEGRGDVKTVAAGIRWAVNHGARVINLSLGMNSASSAIDIALLEAQLANVIVVAAAGNRGAAIPEYPAASPRTIAVAASDVYDHPADFTSYGSYVDIAAPGVGIRSAYPGGQYRLWSGTSMSAPFVSGTAALLLSLHPTWSSTQVMARLRQSARAIIGASGAQTGGLGWGALDTRWAVEDDRPPGPFVDVRISATLNPDLR
jgi:subtilisin family serine protease